MELKRLSFIYDELLKLHIELNFQDVPTPAYIQERLIQCNEYQIKVERFFIEVTRDLSNASRMFKTEKMDLESLRRQTLLNNEKIKKLPTGKERESAADELLETNIRNILKLENEMDGLTSLLSAVKQKQTTLKGVNADIKTLVRIMEQQINRLNVGHPDDPDVKGLAKTFSDIDKIEEELELDGVESSMEIPQSESSEELINSDDSVSVELEEPGESVASGEQISIDESIMLGDELEQRTIPTAPGGEGSQSIEDIEESLVSVSETPGDVSDQETIPTAPQGDDRQGDDDIETELASFLMDDASDVFIGGSEEDPSTSDEVVTETAEPVTTEAVEPDLNVVVEEEISVDIDMEDEITGDVESSVSPAPMVEVDLKDIGFDIDFDEAPAPSKSTKSSPPTNQTNTNATKSAPVKAAVKKEAEVQTPAKKSPPVETKANDISDIDLNDILNQL